MKVVSVILVICAGVAAASSDHCVQETYPQSNVGGTAYQLKELWLLPFKNSWSLRIPSFEICINTKPTAVSVTVCDEDAGSKPSIYIFNPRVATIRRNTFSIKNAVVYVTVFCDSSNTVKRIPNGKRNESLKIGRQFKQNKRPLIRKGRRLNRRYLFDPFFIPVKVPVPFQGGMYRQPQISSLDGTQHQLSESLLDGTDHIPNTSPLDGTLYKSLISLPTKSYLNGLPHKPYEGSLVGSLPFHLDGSNGLVSALADLPNKGYLDESLPKQFNSLVAASNNKFLDGTPYETPYKQLNSFDGIPNKSYLDGALHETFKRFLNSLPTQNYFNRPPYNPYTSLYGKALFGNIPFHLDGIPSDFESFFMVGRPSIIYMDGKPYKPSEGPPVAAYRNSDKDIGDDTFYKPVNGFENIPLKLSLATATESISEDYLNS